MVFSYLIRAGGGDWKRRDSEYARCVSFLGSTSARGKYPRDFTVFDLAEKFGISPLEVMQWPAAVYARAAMWFSSRNQAEADRAKNAERERERERQRK